MPENYKYIKYHESLIKSTADKLRGSLTGDVLIIQAVSNVIEIDKMANMLSKRLREWYELYCPEFSRALPDNESFTEMVLTKSREDMLKEINEKETIGSEFKKEDLDAVKILANKVKGLFEYKEQLVDYIEKTMKEICPNILTLTGPLVGAKLILLASGLKRLSGFPASTIQLLGAEKALFRHMKNKRHKPPKYGILLQHQMVNNSKRDEKGKVARMLADKISIAARVDYFKGEFVGDKLKQALEKRLGK